MNYLIKLSAFLVALTLAEEMKVAAAIVPNNAAMDKTNDQH